MIVGMSVGRSLDFELHEALLIYRSVGRSDGPNVFITNHSVLKDENGVPHLQAGVAVDQDFAIKALEELQGATKAEFLPENVLMRTRETIAWWVPASCRTMYYDGNRSDELTALSGKKFPQPPLLIRAGRGSMKIRALAKNTRPQPETKVFKAPYWNVNDQGDVCLGNSRVPKVASPNNINGWVDGFFLSAFTHPNVHSKLINYRRGFAPMWLELRGKKHFPEKYLVAASETVEQFLASKE